MAQILKRCDCPRKQWGKCPHSWTVRWWGTDSKQHEKSFKRNHRAATEHAKTVEAGKLSIRRGDPPPAPAQPAISLQSYAETWLAGLVAPPNTVKTYSSALHNHVLPQHGRRDLAEVAADREGIQALLRAVSPGMAPVVLTTMRSMLTEAKASGRITGDRLTRLRIPATRPAGFIFPTHRQLTALAAGMGELGATVWIMRGCGLRPSEALAVRGTPEHPGGPGLAGGRLRITEQQTMNGTGRAPLKARKAGDFRDVPVPGYAAAAIRGLHRNGYLFTVPADTFRRRYRNAAAAAGLKGFRAHDLRHIFASVALSAGVPVTDVSRWLGHQSIQTTYQTYSHFIPDSWDQARAALDGEYEKWSAS